MDSSATAIDELFSALARGDVAAAEACCTKDMRTWHSFDHIELNLEQASQGWVQFIAAFPERAFVDVRRTAIPGGFLQRHLMVARTQAGTRLGWPICIVVGMRGGRISRIDEYIDRAGSYPVDEDSPRTPGLPKV